MTPQAFDRIARSLPAATMTVQWGDAQVYKVGEKMFAILREASFSLKVTEVAYEVLCETGRAIPAPYLARARWLRFSDVAAQDEAEVADWLKTAHGLVAAKLTRKARVELGL